MTVHLPEDLERSLMAEVERGHFATVDEAIAEAVRSYLGGLGNGSETAQGETAYDVLRRAGLIGCVDGPDESPTDLATNPAHMEGFGRGG